MINNTKIIVGNTIFDLCQNTVIKCEQFGLLS